MVSMPKSWRVLGTTMAILLERVARSESDEQAAVPPNSSIAVNAAPYRLVRPTSGLLTSFPVRSAAGGNA
jgi:hypothetical protein